jgi:hypothetical protein
MPRVKKNLTKDCTKDFKGFVEVHSKSPHCADAASATANDLVIGEAF